MKKLSDEQKKRETELLAVCKEWSGEYLPTHHGKGSWATTYSNEFVNAAADLCLLYKDVGCSWGHETILHLYVALRDQGIQSCRGGVFNFDTTKYLYQRPIFREFQRRGLIGS